MDMLSCTSDICKCMYVYIERERVPNIDLIKRFIMPNGEFYFWIIKLTRKREEGKGYGEKA